MMGMCMIIKKTIVVIFFVVVFIINATSYSLATESSIESTLTTVEETSTMTSEVIALPDIIEVAAQPAPNITMSLSTDSVNFGLLPQPPDTATIMSALNMTIQSSALYTLSYTATDFINSQDGSMMFPSSNLTQRMTNRGKILVDWNPVLSEGSQLLTQDKGNDTFVFDYSMSSPDNVSEGIYSMSIFYTVVIE